MLLVYSLENEHKQLLKNQELIKLTLKTLKYLNEFQRKFKKINYII